MGQAFSKKPLKEVIRENQRMIKKAIRELERETTTLQNQEKKLQTDIKKLAGQGQMGAVRIMAKDLTIRSQEAMTQAMKGVTKAMVAINKQVSVPALQKMMTEFMKESERSEMTQEMVGEAMDSAFEEDGMAAEEDAVVDQVLAELGIQQADAAPEVPSEQPMKSEEGRSEAAQVEADPSMSELEARLNNLRRS